MNFDATQNSNFSICRKMYSNTNLETTLGEIVFNIYYYPSWFKGLYFVLGSLALLSNAACLGYIYKRLNLSNIVNLIPLLDCVNNIVGFCIIAITSLLALIDQSFGNLSCYLNIPLLGTMAFLSKY